MGLTIIAYVIGVITMLMGSYVRDRFSTSASNRLIYVSCLGFGIMAVSTSLALDLAGWSNKTIPPFLLNAGTLGSAMSAIFFLRLAFSFPYESKSKAVNAVSWIAVIAAGWVLLFNPWHSLGVDREGGQAVIVRGPYYLIIEACIWGLMAFSVIVLVIRAFTLKSRIYKLQSAIVAMTAAAVIAVGFTFHTVIAERWPFLYPVSSVAGLAFMLGVYWAVSITKLFDVREIAGRVAAFTLFSALAGVPVGAGAAWLLQQWDVWPGIPLAGTPVLILLASVAFSAISDRFFKAFSSRGAYLEQLERGLAQIDFSQGRGIVFERLSELLRDSMAFNDFSVMIEESDGNLAVAYSNCGARLTIEHKESPFEFVINMKADILLKTEAVTNRNFHTVKAQLLSIYEALKAEALIVLREGNHVIGGLALGAKRTGSDYTAYDSSVLRMVYAKLFAIGFYLKNIAKESILTTVDRELQYSTQIIASVQENIDRIVHPKVDLAFVSKATRKRGGDFIDFVKLSGERWFFVLGDVSGKGLNASMSMVILKSTLRVFLKEEKDFGKLIVKANAFIKNNLPRGTFFAGIIGMFDFSKDLMYFVNCGIPLMFMYSPQFNNVMEVQGEGRVLGFVRDYAPYLRLRKITLQRGSILFMTTDGIIEAESVRGERYGKERVQRSVSEYRDYNAETMVHRAYVSLSDFVSGAVEDDVTLMALKYGIIRD